MTSIEWLVLDNLKNYWSFHTSLSIKQVSVALENCKKRGWVSEAGRLTTQGEIAHRIEPIEQVAHEDPLAE